jgi:S1-C subfamily serine protease
MSFNACLRAIVTSALILTLHGACSHLRTTSRITDRVSNSVVYVTDKSAISGGTGFHIQSKTGTKYMITNAHVCSHTQDEDGNVYVRKDENDTPIPRRIIQISDLTDLCIVEAMPGATTIPLAEEDPFPDQELHAVGHPHLQAITMTVGSMIQLTTIDIPVSDDVSPGACDLPKNKRSKILTFFGVIEVCVDHLLSISTTIQIQPGNSGSPVLDEDDHIRGVVYAGDSSNWGFLIPLSALKTFLTNY